MPTHKSLTILLPLLLATSTFAADAPPRSKLTLQSSDPHLLQAFNWAKRQAMDYVFDANDENPVGPWYEAALPGREAFCMRDTAHQSMGAQALGLAPYTRNMLHRFAENISDSKDWCSYWEIDRYNRPAPVDYKNDQEFWYNLPANFDVLDACYRMYLWTGDQTYFKDPVFLNFYDRTMNDYIDRWDLSLDKIMKRDRHKNISPANSGPEVKFGFNRGIPGYQESNATYAVGLDVLCSQYAAYRAYSQIQALRGNADLAKDFAQKAAYLRDLIQTTWWDSTNHHFYARLSKDFQLEGTAGMDLLYWNVAQDGPQLQSAVDIVVDAIKETPSSSVEGQSHHAEVLYRYGVPDVAYSQMLDLAGEHYKRREYPEASYSVIGAIVTGTMGITVEASSPEESEREGYYVDRAVKTLPGLTKETAWAELKHLPIRANEVGVKHEGAHKTTFTNERGPALIWQAEFVGESDTLLVDGEPLKAHAEKGYLGRATSWIRVPVGAGDSVTVEFPELKQ